ncbi:hypothetical protein IWW48_001000 [Coemansia sp. RSA 1200]|nr:hypothetical protein IWW48_001000 [Coemansia sp. RSA 1200]
MKANDTDATTNKAPADTTTGGDTATKKPAKRKTTTEMREAKRQKLHQERNGFDQTRDNAHNYLRQWTERSDDWKFNSAKQRWIVQHIYSDSLVPDDIFDIAVKYLAQSRGESLRASMMDDARLVIDPTYVATSGGGDDGKANARRLRALGLFPSHVTKGEANAMKKARAQAKLAGASDAGPDGAAPPPKPIVSNLAADQDSANVEVSENTVGRARRIIEALSKPPQQDDGDDNSSRSKKRKSASDAESTVTEKSLEKKKVKKDKDVLAKGKKQAKKEKKRIKKEKRMEKEQRKARKLIRKAEKEKKRAKKKAEKAERKKRNVREEKAKGKE